MISFRFTLRVLLCIAIISITSIAQAQIEITDSHGKYRFVEPPKRVVVLNWALAEQMLELGEVPIGMADINGYHRHVGAQSVPESVVDVGGRLVPNMAEISALKPEIILIGYSQRPFLRPLSNIATVVYFKNFGKRYNNQEKAQDRFLELAKLFNKSDFAVQKLIERDQKLAILRAELGAAYQGKALPSVQFLVPESGGAIKKDVLLVLGENSMPYYAAQALGLSVVGGEKNNQFGIARLKMDAVRALNDAKNLEVCQFYLSSYSDADSVDMATNQCVLDIKYQNAFGGVMSILYLAEAISSALKARIE